MLAKMKTTKLVLILSYSVWAHCCFAQNSLRKSEYHKPQTSIEAMFSNYKSIPLSSQKLPANNSFRYKECRILMSKFKTTDFAHYDFRDARTFSSADKTRDSLYYSSKDVQDFEFVLPLLYDVYNYFQKNTCHK